MKKLLLTIMILSLSLFANTPVAKMGCVLSQTGDVIVGWTAYKTPSKKGVSGIFDTSTYTPANKEGKNFKEILVGSTLAINTTSINSENEGRDKKLVEQFFKLFSTDIITAKITDIQAKSKETGKPKTGTIMIDINMNGVTKNIPMHYTFQKGTMHAHGFLDILDFQGSKALASINKACFDLHQGKTWNDVAITFDMQIKADLCNVNIKH